MMNEKNLPKSYWVEAANVIVYIMNQCTTSEVHDVTPMRGFMERSQTYPTSRYSVRPHMRIFPMKSDKKLDPKLTKCILVGCSFEQKGYKCFNPSTCLSWARLATTHDVPIKNTYPKGWSGIWMIILYSCNFQLSGYLPDCFPQQAHVSDTQLCA